MAVVNGIHGDISRVLVLGDNYAGAGIIKALSASDIDLHVAHPHVPIDADDRVTYHTDNTSKSWTPLFSEVKPDLIISTVSGGSFEAQKHIIDCAIEAGISRFIPPEFGQDSLNTKIQDRLPPHKERARTIECLRQLAEDGRINWVAVATGATLDRGILSGNLGFDLKWQSATLHGKEHVRFAASSSRWVGCVIMAVIERWQDVKNQYLYTAGLTTSSGEVVKCLEKSTGKSFEVGRGDVDDCVHEAERRIQMGFPDAGMFLMERSVLYDETLDAVGPFERGDAKHNLGLEGELLESMIKAVVHDHEHHGGAAGCGCD